MNSSWQSEALGKRDTCGWVRIIRGPARTLLFTVLLGVSPFLSNGQSFGVSAGWLHASGNRIADLDNRTTTADFVQPGLSLGAFVTTRDTGSSFRCELGWERQGWEQRFFYRFPYNTNLLIESYAERSGRASVQMDLLRFAPQASIALGPRTYFLVGVDFRFLVRARTSEVAVNTYTFGAWGSNPSGTQVVSADSVYSSLEGYNRNQAAFLVGLEQVVHGRLSLGASVSVGHSLFIERAHNYEQMTPVTFRCSVNWRLL